MDPEMKTNGLAQNPVVWIGIAAGAAIGIGLALTRNRRRTSWDSARQMTRRVADRSNEIADATRDIVDRVKTIYEESCRVIEDAGELWAHGRKMVGY